MNKETLSHIKPKRTPEQIAVEGRSPNRGERIRLERIRRRTKARKETFVEEKRLGKTDEEAAAIILTPLERVLQWQRYDIDFGKECREAIETLRLRAQGGIATLLPQAVEVAEKLLKSSATRNGGASVEGDGSAGREARESPGGADRAHFESSI